MSSASTCTRGRGARTAGLILWALVAPAATVAQDLESRAVELEAQLAAARADAERARAERDARLGAMRLVTTGPLRWTLPADVADARRKDLLRGGFWALERVVGADVWELPMAPGWDWRADRPWSAKDVAGRYGDALRDALPPDLRAWATGFRGVDPALEPERWRDARAGLMLAPGADAEACRSGRVAGCWRLLDGGVDSRLRLPETARLAGLLTDHALDVGGPGAFDRLLDAEPGPHTRLAAASRLGEAALWAGFLARIHAEGRRPSPARPSAAVPAAVWTALLLISSLASPRWRLDP